MNKYSSKAVKTAATVGMSLAMVLSNAAPVFAEKVTTNYATDGICKEVKVITGSGDGSDTDGKADCGTLVYVEIMGKLDGTKFSTLTIDSDLKVADKNGKKVTLLVAIAKYAEELKAFAATDGLGYTEKANINTWVSTVKALEDYLGTGALEKGEYQAPSSLDTVLKNVYNMNGEGGTDWSVIDKNNYVAAKEALEKLKTFKKDYGKYIGIVSNDEYAANDLATDVMDAFTTLNNNINEYLGVTADSDLSDFVLAFDAILQNDLDEKATDLKKAVSNDKDAKKIWVVLGLDTEDSKLTPETIKLNDKNSIKKRIDLIKNHDNYDRFKDEDSVIAILDTYQELIDNIGANSDVLKSDAYNDYIKTKVSNVKKNNKVTLKNFLNDIKTDNALDTAAKKAEALADMLNSEQWEILKAAKEDVMDSIYTMETRKVGNYYVDKSDFTSNSTNSQQNTFKTTFPEFLYTLVDKEEGKFGYDVVAEHMEKVEGALKAVTTDIAKITPANIKASDKAALEAAEDAIYELEKGDYSDNLTKDEGKTVRTASTKIENLREAFDNLGTTNVAGWYDMGNGNWGYNNEDGTPAAYKWVASGSDWYMIKDGKMLRNTWLATDGGRWYYLDNAGKMVMNQSVDGCWINSYGVYMSPSYNG
ncbi:hypothetical protein [Dielma fastidiosa]|uniref:hypothetical protein n=1 Tax=Dielma fastidiosa TaxID=1034346 RepID=UPI0023EFFC7C|nr:hypothetical protein [Dielma fastidiosa]